MQNKPNLGLPFGLGFEDLYAPQQISVDEIGQFVGMLHRSNLLVANVPGQGGELLKRDNQRRRQKWLELAGNFLCLRFRGIDPDRFRVNAFGSDHEDRPELPAIAQRRAGEALGLDIAGERLVVIGDTPADIDCGRSLGARAIGVASGHYTVEQLQSHNPYAVFPSLKNTQQVLETILNA